MTRAAAVCAAFFLFALAAAIFGKPLGPDATAAPPVVAAIWSLCELLTTLLLFVEFYRSGRLAIALLAAAYGFCGVLSCAYIASAIQLARTASLGIGQQQIPTVLYLARHVVFALFVIAAIVYERRGERLLARADLPRAMRIVVIATIAGAVCLAITLFASSPWLPTFVVRGAFQPAYWAGGIPLAAAVTLAALACIVFRRQRPRGLILWIAVALFASLLDDLLNVASPMRSTYAWDAGKLLMACTAAIVLVFVLLDLVAQLRRMMATFELRTNRGASRMRGLWQMMTTDGLSETDHVQMILETAAANIRVDRDVLGVLGHLEDGMVVIDATVRQDPGKSLSAAANAYAPRRRIPLPDDVFALVSERGRTCTWHNSSQLDGLFCSAAGLRSIIATPIFIGSQSHFLLFGSPDGMSDEPFIESDVAFIDVVASNISHRFHQRTQLERLQYQIEHDSLTGLYNRTQFNRFGRISAAAGSLFGIILINLDSFRSINERAGHMIGDELLVEIGSALRDVSENDVVARLGGDEFAVLLRSSGGAETLALKLHDYERVFHRPFHTGDRDGKIFLNVGASIGAAHFGNELVTFDEALTQAGIALEHAKNAGGHRSMVFGPDLQYVALQRSLEDTEIHAAFSNDEFVLEYQPTVEMQSRTIVGAEALIRWNHPTRGRLPPAAFLASVKRANLLGAMTTWVLERVTRDLLSAPLPGTVRCYVNAPAQVLESDAFLNMLQQTLETHPVLSTKLGLEVTESEVMDKVERAIETLKTVRQLGLLVAIDDFGTGYSSLSYLKRLPIDVVKLDKSFIDGLPDDQNDTALATMFLALTKQFALVSVGEGIETEQQATWLREHGCMIGQGYLFSKPIPYGDLLELIQTSQFAPPVSPV